MTTIDTQKILDHLPLITAAVVTVIAFFIGKNYGHELATQAMIDRQIEADFEHDQELNQRLSERIENAIKQANHDRK